MNNINFFEVGGRMIPKALSGKWNFLGQADLSSEAPTTQTLTVSLQQQFFNLLDGNGETPGGSSLANFAGRNGHLGRREMRRFNRLNGLGMDAVLRAAYRRHFNGNDHAGDNAIMNNFYGGLNSKLPAAAQAKLDLDKRDIETARNNAMKDAWEKYSATLTGPKATLDENLNFGDVTALLKYLLSQANGADSTWDDNLGGMGTADNKYGDKTARYAQAYYNSLNGADQEIFRKAMSGVLTNGIKYYGSQNAGNALSGFAAPKKYTPTQADFDAWREAEGNKIWEDDYSSPEMQEKYNSLHKNSANAAAAIAAAGLKPVFKQGGNLNMTQKYRLGGATPQEQDMLQQIVQLVQAAMSGDEQATLTIQKIMEAAQQGDQQAALIAQMIQEVTLQMQQQAGGAATAAKRGAKLNYIHKLNTGCPAGTELQYYKKGGHICKACVKKAKKAMEGAEVPEEKCGGKTKKKYFQSGGQVSPTLGMVMLAGAPSSAMTRGGYTLPEVVVTGLRPWYFDRRLKDLGNGRGIISESNIDYYGNGDKWLGDGAIVRSGRTIYTSPAGNDTIYWVGDTRDGYDLYSSGQNSNVQWSDGIPVSGKSGVSQSTAKKLYTKDNKRATKHEKGGGINAVIARNKKKYPQYDEDVWAGRKAVNGKYLNGDGKWIEDNKASKNQHGGLLTQLRSAYKALNK